MSDHDMRIGEPGARTSDDSTQSDNAPSLAQSVPAPSAASADDPTMGSPKGGGSAEAADTGAGRYGGEQDLQPGDLDPFSAGTMPMGGEGAGSDRPNVTDTSDAQTAGQARQAAQDMGRHGDTTDGGEVH